MRFPEYEICTLCERRCGVNRYEKVGYCRSTAELLVAKAGLHKWEEPPISGTRGSGTIFFSGCSLGCVFCQNSRISDGNVGKCISTERLAEIMLRLEDEGAHNVNLVTPTHYIPSVAEAIKAAKKQGLSIPIVYNTGSYETVEGLSLLSGLVDIYLPDLKYFLPTTAMTLSHAENYPTVARDAIAEMFKQTGRAVISSEGMMTRGVIVRILLLPAHVAEAKLSLKYLYDTYGDKIYVSLMSQYTPISGMTSPLDRRVTREEYRQLTDYAERLGMKNCFVQELSAASEDYIPDFDLSGV